MLAMWLFLTMAAWCDLRTRRIPNRLCLWGFIAGVVIQSWYGTGIGDAVTGAAAGMAVMLPLYALRAVHGGDVKLVAALGAYAGWSEPVLTAVVAVFFSAAAAAAVLTWRGQWGSVAAAIFNSFAEAYTTGSIRPLWKLEGVPRTPFPFAAAIAFGALCLQLRWGVMWLAPADLQH